MRRRISSFSISDLTARICGQLGVNLSAGVTFSEIFNRCFLSHRCCTSGLVPFLLETACGYKRELMSFGLENVPHTYCQYVMTVFRTFLGMFVQTYVAYIAVYNEDFRNHLRHQKGSVKLVAKGETLTHSEKSTIQSNVTPVKTP